MPSAKNSSSDILKPAPETAPTATVARALTDMHRVCILDGMRTTLNIDDGLLAKAARLVGITEKTALVRKGLEALVALESARRLAALGGTEKRLTPISRRRSARSS